ncbi:MAG: tRNA (adenosine(37)-N6)-threonylcarbamoyltransferase complex ATPase subunit type 1 TsaE [Planctomycetota bacterium]
MKSLHPIAGLAGTTNLARRLASLLRPGDIVRLEGPLGAGKTTLVRALAEAMAVDTAAVSSPTYVIAHRYEGKLTDLVHIDAYRLTGDDDTELGLLGWDTLVGPESNAVAVIEWASRIDHLLPQGTLAINLIPTGPTSRDAEIVLPDAWGQRPGAAELLATAEPASGGDLPKRAPTICRVTGRPVPADSPTWPFIDERARMADLHGWFSEGYTVSRPMEQADLEQGE